MTLAGKVALITGGAQGIGRAFSEALLRKGARVCIVDRNVPVGEKCLEELKKRHGAGKITFAQCDVTKTAELEAAFQKTKTTFGRLDILANNAGIGVHPDPLVVLDVNLKAVICGTELGLKHMGKDSGGEGGVIINTASMAAFMKTPQSPAYAATKAGVMMLSRCYGDLTNFKKHGVRVNCICPSFTHTAMLEEILHFDETFTDVVKMAGTVDIEMVAEGFMKLVEDTSKTGVVMRVTAQKGIDYKIFTDDPKPGVAKGSKL